MIIDFLDLCPKFIKLFPHMEYIGNDLHSNIALYFYSII